MDALLEGIWHTTANDNGKDDNIKNPSTTNTIKGIAILAKMEDKTVQDHDDQILESAYQFTTGSENFIELEDEIHHFLAGGT